MCFRAQNKAGLINHQGWRHRDGALESLTCLHCSGQNKKQGLKNKFCDINQCKTKCTGCKALIHQHSPSHSSLFGYGSVYICVCVQCLLQVVLICNTSDNYVPAAALLLLVDVRSTCGWVLCMHSLYSSLAHVGNVPRGGHGMRESPLLPSIFLTYNTVPCS